MKSSRQTICHTQNIPNLALWEPKKCQNMLIIAFRPHKSDQRAYYGLEWEERGCPIEQLLEVDVSALGFPLPFFGGLGVLRCLDDVPRGVLLVRSAAASRVGSEGTGSSTWYSLAI